MSATRSTRNDHIKVYVFEPMSDRRLPTKAEKLEIKIRQIDRTLRAQLKQCADENQELLERIHRLSSQILAMRRANSVLRTRLHVLKRYEVGATKTSTDYEPERTLHF